MPTEQAVRPLVGRTIAKIKGKGTGTSDDVPIVAAGQRVATSNGEGVLVLPAKMMSNEKALRAVEAIIQEANGGRPPVPRTGQARKMAGGGIIDGVLRLAEKVLPAPSGETYRAKQGSREAEPPSPAKTFNADARNPRTVTPVTEKPPSGGFQEEAERRRKQMAEAMSYKCGGILRKMRDGGVVEQNVPDSIDRFLIEYRAGAYPPGSALRGADPTGDAGAIVRQGSSFSMAPTGYAGRHVGGTVGVPGFQRLAPPAAPASDGRSSFLAGLPEGGLLLKPEGRQALRTAFSGEGLRPDASLFGPRQQSAPAAQTGPAGDAGAIVRQGNSFTMLRQPEMAATSVAGSAQPQPVAAGAGGPDKPLPRGNSFSETGTARPPGALLLDVFGNDTGPTQQYQRQLDQVRAENEALARSRAQAMDRAPGTSYEEQQNAKSDRFNRFVNESNTARLANDLAKGGGWLRSESGRIAALKEMQDRDAAAQASELTRSAKIIEANNVRRGQDLQAKDQQNRHETALMQVLGSPLQQQAQMLDAAIKGGQLNAVNVLQSLQQMLLDAGKAKDVDAQARYALLIQQLQGKSPESKLVTIGGGQEIDQTTGALRALPSHLAYTGPAPTIVSAPQQTGLPAPKSKADMDKLPSGTRYRAPDGTDRTKP